MTRRRWHLQLCVAYCATLVACSSPEPGGWLTRQQYRLTAEYHLKGVPQDASGLSYDVQRNGLWLVSDDPATLYFLNLGGQVIQTIRLDGFDDPEAVAWTGSGNPGESRLVLSEERRGRLVALQVNAGTKSIRYDNARQIAQMDKQGSNNGIEGLTYRAADASLWFATEYHPQAVYRLDTSGLPSKVWNNPLWRYPWDYSGMVHVPEADSMLVISDRNRVLIEYNLEGREVSRLALENIPNPEGIAITADGTIFICSEPNRLFRLSPTRPDQP